MLLVISHISRSIWVHTILTTQTGVIHILIGGENDFCVNSEFLHLIWTVECLVIYYMYICTPDLSANMGIYSTQHLKTYKPNIQVKYQQHVIYIISKQLWFKYFLNNKINHKFSVKITNILTFFYKFFLVLCRALRCLGLYVKDSPIVPHK